MHMLLDAHSHLQLPEYDADRDAVIGRMREAGVKTIVVGVDMATSEQAIALAEQHSEDIGATVGTHPADNPADFDYEKMRVLAGHPKVVAIGECGLDYYRLGDDAEQIKKTQKELFLRQMDIAKDAGKPLMVHCRPKKGTDDAYEDLIAILKNKNYKLNTIIHFFVGSPVVAEQFLELGSYFTFGGVITFARDYDAAIRRIPLNRILLETDAPYVAPAPYRGKRNEPAYVIEVAKKMAELKDMPYEEVAAATAQVAREAFDLPFVF